MRTRLVPPTAAVVAAGACAIAVGISGELSPGAHVAVGVAGAVVVCLGLARRSGESAPPVGRRALPWLGCLAAVLAWEVVALAADDLPTVSDLADPVLAHPVVRAGATLAWLAGGAWLVTRPQQVPAAAMRTVPGRVAVLLSWLWLGVHFLAR